MSAEDRKQLLLQFILYACVGVVSCSVDLSFFLFFSWLDAFPLFVATSLSFIFATLVNYLLCSRFVFSSGAISRFNQLLRIFFIAGIGLLLNSLGFVLLSRFIPYPPFVVKISVIPFVMFWNFLGRRLFVFTPEIPPAITQKLERFLKRII